jgi:predicted enzyme related to lactoylglutathione lyase
MNMGPQLSGILQIAIPVQDIERATAFYRDVRELKFLMNGPNMAFFNCGGVRLYLASGEGGGSAGGNSSIYFRTSDINKQLSALKARNVVIHQEPQTIARMPDHDLWLMWFKDSEGNLLGVMEERKK